MVAFKSFLQSRKGMVLLLIVLLFLIGIVWFSMNFTGKNRLITAVEIKIQPDTGIYFISVQDAADLITKTVGNPNGQSAGTINLTAIETTFKRLPFISSSQVFVGLDGKLKINLVQRTPVIRIHNLAGETFFLDSSGVKIPHKGYFAPDVPVASGNIPELLKDSNRIRYTTTVDLLAVAKKIYTDPFWNAQFEQLYVDNFNDIILIPRVGRHSIVIGSSENIAEKLENLRAFYMKGLRNLGWEKYHTIDLRYRGQVIGIKDAKQTEQPKVKNVQKQQHSSNSSTYGK
jgi:cell division protein FtsQ